MEKTRVLFVITKGVPFGGAQRYVYDLATGLRDRYDTIVACGSGDLFKEKLKEEKIKVIDLEYAQRDVGASTDWKLFWELIKIIKEERPDVLHLNSSKVGGIGALAGRIMRVKKIIFTGHGWAFNENRGLPQKIVIYFFHWLTILLSHTTIAVSEKAKKDIALLPFVENKIKVIHNGIDKFKTKTKKEARILLAGEETKKIVVISISELHRNKGIDVALKAIARLNTKISEKIIYCIAGDGEERNNLEKMAENLGVTRSVRFLGFVPNAKELLSGADIFLLPSRTEAFPYALLEAGMAGVPIVASSVGGTPEIVSDMQDGILVHPRDPREIAEAIAYLVGDPEKRKIFKEKTRAKIASNFSKEKMLAQTTDLYDSLVP